MGRTDKRNKGMFRTKITPALRFYTIAGGDILDILFTERRILHDFGGLWWRCIGKGV